MNVIRKVSACIIANPQSRSSQILARLAIAVETEEDFSLRQLYELDYNSFQLALEMLRAWRLDRYYGSKFQLLDLAALAANQGI